MKALGIGVRVRIGWCPADWATTARAADVRMSEGTISGRPLVLENGRYWPIPQDGSEVWVWEPLLTPISDDDPDAVTEPVEQEVEA